MLSYQEAYKIAAEVHKDQKDKAGGPYIDFLQSVADYLKNKGESEEVQTLAILTMLMDDKYIQRQERRELKTKFRLKKYKSAIEALGV